MKKTESKEKKLFKALNEALPFLAWNVDISFAKLILPLVRQYLKDGFDTIAFGYLKPNFIDRFFIYIFSKLKLIKYVDIIRHANDIKWYKKLKNVEEALNDILIENSEEWIKKWGLKEFYPIEHDSIPEVVKGKQLYRLVIRPEYLKNRKKNSKISYYNNKRINKCYKWRKKQLHWFIDNLQVFWW